MLSGSVESPPDLGAVPAYKAGSGPAGSHGWMRASAGPVQLGYRAFTAVSF